MGQHGKHGPLVRGWASVALAAGVLTPAPALACRLALLLAMDVSSSVDAAEDTLQRNGLAAALIAPEVERAFLSQPGQPVALAAFEWSGRYRQKPILNWTLIRSGEDLLAAAGIVSRSVRSETEFPTALGYALGHAAELFESAPRCDRRVIDVSGDGVNNEGFPPRLAYRHFPLDDVTVNALAIGGDVPLPEMVDYYAREVIRGPGAFVEAADGFDDFERAMKKKLEREVSALILGALE